MNIHGRPGLALSTKEHQTEHADLINKLLLAQDASESMRIWLEAGIKKEEIANLLKNLIEPLRKKMLENNSQEIARALRNMQTALENPVSQNWQLVAENLIVSI